jgi:hypothetical protein
MDRCLHLRSAAVGLLALRYFSGKSLRSSLGLSRGISVGALCSSGCRWSLWADDLVLRLIRHAAYRVELIAWRMLRVACSLGICPRKSPVEFSRWSYSSLHSGLTARSLFRGRWGRMGALQFVTYRASIIGGKLTSGHPVQGQWLF